MFLKKMNDQGNILLSYLSIGEAEDYRYYWKDVNPKIIIKENEQWKGNFLVKFWKKQWHDIIYRSHDSYLSKIIELGFQGVYLDRIDVFYYFKDKTKQAKRMERFVRKLSAVGKSRKENFFVIAQNASHIIKYLPSKYSYLSAIDAIAIEDLFYFGKKRENNTYNPQSWVLKDLTSFRRAGKLIFNVEYLSDQDKIKQYQQVFRKHSVIPFISNRDLDGAFKWE